MELEKVKAIHILSRYEIEYVPKPNGILHQSTYDGYCNTSDSKLALAEYLPDSRKSFVLWHEIIHIIDNVFHIKSTGQKMTEEEIDRLAAGLQSLKIEYREGEKIEGEKVRR